MPYLEWASERIMPHLTGVNWRKNRCPVCNGEPNFAYLDRDDGVRWLICSRCRAEWRYKRLVCPFCENDDPAKLKYYPAGEKKNYRLYVCDVCTRYLKAVDLRKAGENTLLLAEPVLTWSLDLAAREEGYV
jgi:FdhE protein